MATAQAARPMTAEEKKVIFASSLGTVFEWYDFYLYGSLAAIIAKQFFSGLDAGSAFIFALLAFAAGFAVRPFVNHPQLGRRWVDDGFGHKLIRVVGWTPPGGQTALSVSYRLPAGTFKPSSMSRYSGSSSESRLLPDGITGDSR